MNLKDLKKGGVGIEFIFAIALVLISVLGIFIFKYNIQENAEERAAQRANDLEKLKIAVESYKLSNGFYPGTGFYVSQLDKYDKKTYADQRKNECDNPNDWILNLGINLPKDPGNSCESDNSYNNNFPRYEYVSDGNNYKIIIYQLGAEICSGEGNKYEKFIDPARRCNSYEASWAVYSEGAKNW